MMQLVQFVYVWVFGVNMPIGIQVTNTSGTIQVDDTYRNMLLVASGQFTVNNQTSDQDLWYTHLQNNVPILSANAMLVMRVVSSVGLSPQIGSYRGTRKVVNFGYIRNTQVTFQYYIYDLVAPTNSLLGFQSFDVYGNLVYDAMDYPFKILATVMIELTTPSQAHAVYTAPHSNVAYGCLGGGNYFSDDGYDGESYICYTYFSGPTLIAYHSYSDQAGGGGQGIGNWGDWRQYGVVVDVTNLPLNFRRA